MRSIPCLIERSGDFTWHLIDHWRFRLSKGDKVVGFLYRMDVDKWKWILSNSIRAVKEPFIFTSVSPAHARGIIETNLTLVQEADLPAEDELKEEHSETADKECFPYEWRDVNSDIIQLRCGLHVLGYLHHIPNSFGWRWSDKAGNADAKVWKPANILLASAYTQTPMPLVQTEQSIEAQWTEFFNKRNVTPFMLKTMIALPPETTDEERPSEEPVEKPYDFTWEFIGSNHHRLRCGKLTLGILYEEFVNTNMWKWMTDKRCSTSYEGAPLLVPFDIPTEYTHVPLEEAKQNVERLWAKFFTNTPQNESHAADTESDTESFTPIYVKYEVDSANIQKAARLITAIEGFQKEAGHLAYVMELLKTERIKKGIQASTVHDVYDTWGKVLEKLAAGQKAEQYAADLKSKGSVD